MEFQEGALITVDDIMAAPDSPASDDISSTSAADGDKGAEADTTDASAETKNTDADGDDSTKDADQAGKDAAGKDDAEDADKGKDDTKDVPFHEHPRFKELIETKNTQAKEIADLQSKLEQALKTQSAQEGPKDVQAQVDDLQAKLDAELDKIADKIDDGDLTDGEARKLERQLVRQFEADKAKVMDNYQRTQAEQERAVKAEEAKFLAERPYLKEVMGSKASEIDTIRSSSKIHDDLSAAQEVYIKDLESKLQAQDAEHKAAVEQARKEAREQAIKEFKAKRNAQTLGGGPASAPSGDGADPQLANPKRFGGQFSVLAQRLDKMRQAGT